MKQFNNGPPQSKATHVMLEFVQFPTPTRSPGCEPSSKPCPQKLHAQVLRRHLIKDGLPLHAGGKLNLEILCNPPFDQAEELRRPNMSQDSPIHRPLNPGPGRAGLRSQNITNKTTTIQDDARKIAPSMAPQMMHKRWIRPPSRAECLKANSGELILKTRQNFK
eukprot:10619591-Karenia_brevis.AAC.1